MMGLFPEPSGSSITSTPKLCRRLFSFSDNSSSKSSGTLKSNENSDSKSTSKNVQQLSTSWEYLRAVTHDLSDIEKEEPHDMAPPRYIEIQKGKISLAPAKSFESAKDKEVLEARIAELEEALGRLHERVDKSQCGSPTLEKDLKEQLENMQKVIRSKERKAMQVCRDHKSLQARFVRQEHCLQILTTENKNLHQRIQQYECCLDDVMRKVVDAIVAEDNLREEVSMLKNRVRDLEAQNAALSSSPAKGRDEGYCTMSSGQPQPLNGHLEDLPEEPEHMQMMAEATSADMEDWSMSQEELGAGLEEYNNEPDWLWQSSSYLNSTVDLQSETISKLLQTTIEYSDDEEIGCKDFTSDFYRLVNIASGSTRSLQSAADASDTDESIPNDRYNISPTPSEAGLAQVSSCSSSDSSEPTASRPDGIMLSDNLRQDVLVLRHKTHHSGKDGTQSMPSTNWRRSNGWRRVSSQYIEPSSNKSSINKDLKIPPPVPARRSFAS